MQPGISSRPIMADSGTKAEADEPVATDPFELDERMAKISLGEEKHGRYVAGHRHLIT